MRRIGIEEAMSARRFLTSTADVLTVTVAIATIRQNWDGTASYVALAVLFARVLLPGRTAAAQFCQSLAGAFLLTYVFRRCISIEVALSQWWIGVWTVALALAAGAWRNPVGTSAAVV